MIVCVVLAYLLFALETGAVLINGKDYTIERTSTGHVSRAVLYENSAPAPPRWVARCVYNKTYLSTGWDTFDIETNPDIDDNDQAFLAGYLEGSETHIAVYDHYVNTVPALCENDKATCAKVQDYFDVNAKWVKGMVESHAASDVYWEQVNLFYRQILGLSIGYNSAVGDDQKLSVKDILWMNYYWDFGDVRAALLNETAQSLRGETHCSALIKIVHGLSDVLVAHNTWTRYSTMRRIAKRYTLSFKNVAATSMSFSGYPGAIVSGDDFYIMNSGLVAQETTNDNNNASLWQNVHPEEQVLEVVRVTVANRLAGGGRSWAKIFSKYNSGTYNNQWMIVDMNKFSPGAVKAELLWVLEQIPGLIRRADQTDKLLQDGYWASYNRPFYPDIYNLTGYWPLVHKYGDFFTYDKTPRALIFKRDEGKVVNVQTMMKLLRYNDFMHDPLSRCSQCSPPFSSENTIAARNDLNPANGSYPFESLGHRASGATDAKVTSFRMSKGLSFLAVSGPTTGAHLLPFQWSRSDFDHIHTHRGHPDLFHFKPVVMEWPEQDRTLSEYTGAPIGVQVML